MQKKILGAIIILLVLIGTFLGIREAIILNSAALSTFIFFNHWDKVTIGIAKLWVVGLAMLFALSLSTNYPIEVEATLIAIFVVINIYGSKLIHKKRSEN